MDDKYAIGIDLGATNFRVGVVTAKGEIVDKHMAAVGQDRKPAHIVDLFRSHVTAFKKALPEVGGVGVGIPGIVDKDEGVVHQSPHYPEWHEVGFGRLLTDAFGLPVVVDNDANMIALGEGFLGAGRGLKSFLMITLGTGIGGGIVCDGEIWHGDNGFAGEIGHTVIDFDGPVCNCGGKGCLEMYASATGLKYMVENSDEPHKEALLKAINGDYEKISSLLLYEMARDGDIFSNLMWKKFGMYLGAGVASLVNALGIFNVVIGGGISRAWDFFIASTEREFKRRIYKRTGALVRLHRAQLGDDGGIIGAARSVLI